MMQIMENVIFHLKTTIFAVHSNWTDFLKCLYGPSINFYHFFWWKVGSVVLLQNKWSKCYNSSGTFLFSDQLTYRLLIILILYQMAIFYAHSDHKWVVQLFNHKKCCFTLCYKSSNSSFLDTVTPLLHFIFMLMNEKGDHLAGNKDGISYL